MFASKRLGSPSLPSWSYRKRAQTYCDGDFEVRLPTPEDLIILKAIANREKAREDIRRISAVYPSLDRARIERWVREYGELLETPELWSEIEPLLATK